jgi:hypothetical protein
MTIIYPINGKNERLGNLFKTPKHLLLYKGVPAIVASCRYMLSLFPDATIVILANDRYMGALIESDVNAFILRMGDTDSQIETLRQFTTNTKDLTGPVMFVDCDIVPISINPPKGNTVYLFENKKWMKQYSNYSVGAFTFGEPNIIADCNEKGKYYPWAGSGLYYFENVETFNLHSKNCKSVSEVVQSMISNAARVYADTTSQVFRFGTLNDIKNDESLTDRIY